MKNKLIFVLYLCIGGLAALLLVASRTPSLAWKFVDDDARVYGDLYNMCKVRYFKVPRAGDRPVSKAGAAERPMSQARVVFFGDSFLEEGFGNSFERLSGVPCCTSWSSKQGRCVTVALDKAGLKKDGSTRYLVFEWVERTTGFIEAPKEAADKEPAVKPGGPSGQSSAMEAFNGEVRRFIADGKGVEYLVTNNPPVARILETRNSFRFWAFGDMPLSVPVYRTDKRMLFYRSEVGFNRHRKTDADVAKIADNLATISRVVREKYGLKTIFMPVPNKFTVYGYCPSIGGDVRPDERYDDFLPKLYEKLAERGETCVDLYHPFIGSGKRLYYNADTHWNRDGIQLAVARLADVYAREEARGVPGQGVR